MKVTGTPAAKRAVEAVRRRRSGALVFTIGTGCCESTAPFLYEDFWPGPDQGVVGEVAGVPVYAPAHLRRLYPGDDGVVIDIEDGLLAESFSIETEDGCRFVLRAPVGGPEPARSERELGSSQRVRDAPRDVPTTVSALRPLGPLTLPRSLEQLRILQTHAKEAHHQAKGG